MPNLSSQCPPTDNSAGANEPLKPGEQVTSLFTASLQHPHITGIWTKLSATLADLCLWIKKKLLFNICTLCLVFLITFSFEAKKKKKIGQIFFYAKQKVGSSLLKVVGHCGKRSPGLLTTLLKSQLMDRRTSKRQKAENCLRYYPCASSAKKCSPSCTSTMPAQNDRGYCTPNNCSVVEKELRQRTEKWNRERNSQRSVTRNPKDRSKKAERANTNRVIAA